MSISWYNFMIQDCHVMSCVALDSRFASHQENCLSVSYGSSVFKFLDLGTRAIETETGVTKNEPVNYAVRAAIEQAVVEIILQGEKEGLWKFKEEKKVNVK